MVNADFFGGLIAKLAIFLVRIVPTGSWYFFHTFSLSVPGASMSKSSTPATSLSHRSP